MAWTVEKKSEEKWQPKLNKPGINNSPVPPFTLVLLDRTKNAPEGTELNLEVPYIGIGRNQDCLVCYGDEFPMVSRLHSAIEWINGSFSIAHLSSTNQTLLNGRPVARKWFLQDGDIIQLAPSGPKMRFKTSGQPAEQRRKQPDIYQIGIVVVVFISVLLLVWLGYSIITDAVS